MLCAFRPGNPGALIRTDWFDKSSHLPSDPSLADTDLSLHLFGDFGPRLELEHRIWKNTGVGSGVGAAFGMVQQRYGTFRK